MALTIEDLQPKDFKINVKGVELTCKPLKLSHALMLSKIGDIFGNPQSATKPQIKQAEVDLDEVIAEVLPELKGIQLDMPATFEILTKMMEQIEPTDNKEIKDKGVSFDADPKAVKAG